MSLFEMLETRRLMFVGDDLLPAADLKVDTNRDGVINALDDKNEDSWTTGRGAHGAIILPNFDKDNTNTAAPDNWTGGVWNGRPVAPNNTIDNAADVLDIGQLRMLKLNRDDAYNYIVTVTLLNPTTSPTWLRNTPATDRVRVFYPSKQLANGDVVPQAGDVAVMGPGLGNTIRFVTNPAAPNEFSVMDLASSGDFVFGVEGIKTGAEVRFQVKVQYFPILTDGGEADPNGPSVTDEVAMRVAPFVVMDNQNRADKVIIDNLTADQTGVDNQSVANALKTVFGDRLVKSNAGDLWIQDGFEIGYVKAPYGQMPVVLELPRARDYFFSSTNNMRSLIRGTLLKAGVGVNTEMAGLKQTSASEYGGDIDSLPIPGAKPGTPGYLLCSDMPTDFKNFFAAQNVNPLLELKLDSWLSVGHVDEVVQLAPGAKKVLVADADLAWALLIYASKINPNVRLHPGMNSNEGLPGYTDAGISIQTYLNSAALRDLNVNFASNTNRLRAVHNTIKNAMKLSEEVFAPGAVSTNKGTGKLLRAGAFTQMLGNAQRSYEIRFVDADQYQLRYRDAGGSPSQWFNGRKSQDEVFPQAKAYLLKNYWTGTPTAGDVFFYKTNPSATMLKMPVLFAGGFTLFEESTRNSSSSVILGTTKLSPFSTNHINALVDGTTVVTGKAYGPGVNWNGTGNRDIFQDYANNTYKKAGFTRIVEVDSRLYHNGSGNIHCGTNVIRSLPTDNWWDGLS